MAKSVTLKFKGQEKLLKALDPARMRQQLKKHVSRAQKLNGLSARAAVRKEIQASIPPKNAALTIALKGSAKPLVGQGGDLFGAITSEVQDGGFTMAVGVSRQAGVYKLAEALHEGRVIKVTPAMRGMFLALARASQDPTMASKLSGRAAFLFSQFTDWKPLKDSTSSIDIPGRPFLTLALRRKSFLDPAKERLRLAVAATFRDLAKGG